MELAKPISPSAFMRGLRPENYSDTQERSAYVLEANTFDHFLETITSRNQTHDFEIFCRKLCERAICPNLRPATGPEGGGDSKADTETMPVASELATLSYAGTPNAGSEKWAFAFSANKDWKRKARKDAEGLAATNRGYSRIIFVTNQYAKGKTRADLEQALSDELGVAVTIHDRSWIMKEVLENDRKDLACNYLGAGQEIVDSVRLGPADYSRTRQLQALEKSLSDPSSYEGMKLQMATEALLAARLSRSLERPRIETDGRFARAIRLADDFGTFRQRLEARYEALWTAVWWFDDIGEVNAGYDAFAAMALQSDHTANVEFVSNLLQMLFNAVFHGGLTREQADIDRRSALVYARLDALAADKTRPNNALEARALLLLGRLNIAFADVDLDRVSAVWPEFADVLKQAHALGEFEATRLVKLIEVFGDAASDDPAFDALVDDVANFVSERSSEAAGALVRLKRADQLSFDRHFDKIRILGRAARELVKKEYAENLITATQLLALSYKSAGLFWAGRAAAIFAAATIVIEGEKESDVDVSIIPTFELLSWLCLQLRHLPDLLLVLQTLHGALKALPLDGPSQERLTDRLRELDMALASNLVNCTAEELNQLERLPDVLEGIGLMSSRFALLYALGYEAELRADGSLPEADDSAMVAEFISILASQPVSDDLRAALVARRVGPQALKTIVSGMEILVDFENTDMSILLAEVTLAAIEATFATTLEKRIFPHAERFRFQIAEVDGLGEPTYEIDPVTLIGNIRWPKDKHPADYKDAPDTRRFLTQVGLMTLASTCGMPDFAATCDRLMDEDAVIDRISLIAASANSYHRLFNQFVRRLGDWDDLNPAAYPIRSTRPTIDRRELPALPDDEDHTEAWDNHQNHRRFETHSVLDLSLWDKAGWSGAAYAIYARPTPPALALMFTDEAQARAIFGRWRERFGPIDKDDDIYLSVVTKIDSLHPLNYRFLITSRQRPTHQAAKAGGSQFVVRHTLMRPTTDENLRRFLAARKETGSYALMPAVITPSGGPKLLTEFAITKRAFTVVAASDAKPGDLEHGFTGVSAED